MLIGDEFETCPICGWITVLLPTGRIHIDLRLECKVPDVAGLPPEPDPDELISSG